MQEFISRNKLSMTWEGFEGGVERFMREMELGLTEKGSSLMMLPTYLSLNKLPVRCERVIVMDAGGTNLRVALVAFDEKNAPAIEYLEVYPMPGTQGQITKDCFFEELAGYLAPIASKSSRIGFCFSYPCETQPNLDGKALQLNKEVDIAGINGALLGECLRAALKEKGLPANHSVVVINDTVATLLGAVADSKGRRFGGYIGLILGTGTNCCYTEQNENIQKNPALVKTAGDNIINMESGGYDKTERTKIDEDFDAGTLAPGDGQFEKMISGAYQGSLMLAYIRAAAAAGCLSKAFGERLQSVSGLKGKEIDAFCVYPYADNKLAALCDGEQDARKLYALIDAYMDRSAQLTVMSLAAILKRTGQGKNPLLPVCISAEGTTFYKSMLLNKKIHFYMGDYVERRMGISYEFMRAENANIAGTAMAAMLG